MVPASGTHLPREESVYGTGGGFRSADIDQLEVKYHTLLAKTGVIVGTLDVAERRGWKRDDRLRDELGSNRGGGVSIGEPSNGYALVEWADGRGWWEGRCRLRSIGA